MELLLWEKEMFSQHVELSIRVISLVNPLIGNLKRNERRFAHSIINNCQDIVEVCLKHSETNCGVKNIVISLLNLYQSCSAAVKICDVLGIFKTGYCAMLERILYTARLDLRAILSGGPRVTRFE